MKGLAKMDVDMRRAAAKAYREGIPLIWAFPESRWERELARALWAKREAMEKEE